MQLCIIVTCELAQRWHVQRHSFLTARHSAMLLPNAVMLMFVTTTWAEAGLLTSVMAAACFYGGFGQMVAGVFEVRVSRRCSGLHLVE